MKEHLSREFSVLKSDGSQLLSDLASAVQTLAEVGKAEAGEKKEKLTQELEYKVAQLRKGIDKAREKGTQTKEKIEQGVSEHPWASVLSAFCVGALVGGLLLRKKS